MLLARPQVLTVPRVSHAWGLHHLVPGARSILEIGGQDSKFITLEDGGRVRDYALNDRCAADTGQFLEVVAARLGLDLATLGELSRRGYGTKTVR